MQYKITLKYSSESLCGDPSCCFEERYDGSLYCVHGNESRVFDEFEYPIIHIYKEHEFYNNDASQLPIPKEHGLASTIGDGSNSDILDFLNNKSHNLHWNIDFNPQNTIVEII